MRGIPDAEQTRAEPLGQPVDANRQKLDVVPASELVYLVSGVGRELADCFAKRLESLLANLVELAFGNNVTTLPVFPPVDHDKDAAGVEASHRLRGIVPLARKAKPKHIHRRAELLHRQTGFFPDDRLATVSRHHKIRAHFERSGRCLHT